MKHLGQLCQVSGKHWWRTREPHLIGDGLELRQVLLDFIADFADWDASIVPEFLQTAQAITQAAHDALAGPGSARPLVMDPFAGGGSIPLETLRIGADAFASDVNPVAALLNEVLLQYLPRFGDRLATAVRRYGEWVHSQGRDELAAFYPPSTDGVTPVAFIWARVARCSGPGCGARIPLLKSLWLSKRRERLTAMSLVVDRTKRTVDVEIVKPNSASAPFPGTVNRGAMTCPVCEYTTPKSEVRSQLADQKGGAAGARLIAVVVPARSGGGREYRLPTEIDLRGVRAATDRATQLRASQPSAVPDELLPVERVWKNNPIRVHLYGVTRWGDMFAPRQQLLLATYARLVRRVMTEGPPEADRQLAEGAALILALAVSRLSDISNAHCQWSSSTTQVCHLFTRQAISMTWDFAEAQPFSTGAAGNFMTTLSTMLEVIERSAKLVGHATVQRQSATAHSLPDNFVHAMFTDPPYYDAVPYATLADFFYVWLKRAVPERYAMMFSAELIPKDEECVVDEAKNKDHAFFQRTMTLALAEGWRVVRPDGLAVVVFAHKSTAGWEAQLDAMITARWEITASWPIDTERENRTRAQDSAALASSIHLVCRPRKNPDGSPRTDDVGDWRDVLTELPKRMHEWLPRLQQEGIVGADAIFACLGPALEIFSRYSSVEDAAGNRIELKPYLEEVWKAVAKEALSVIFSGASASGFESDALLTAMWLWTLFSASTPANGSRGDEDGGGDEDDESNGGKTKAKLKGFALEFDAARKIAQGLGADLAKLGTLVEVDGEVARLLSVDERKKALFGKVESTEPATKARTPKRKNVQLTLGFAAPSDNGPPSDLSIRVGAGPVQPGRSVLDRVHQAMLLFGAGQGPALKRFLVDGQVGQDDRFWTLAQHLSALYPAASSEKRLVDGVLARKKGLGF